MKSRVFTKHSEGSLKQLAVFSIPLVLALLSSHLPNLCDRLFLARYSAGALKGCAAAGGLILLFHVFVLRITSIAQAFIAEYIGQGNLRQIGPFTWQMIWFSIGIMFIVIPIGKCVAAWFFRTSEVKEFAQLYFDYMLYGTVFIGIECVLSSFYSGIGRTKIVLYFHLLAHLLNILFSYLLIFGIEGFINEMGLRGAAIGTILSKGIAALLFFSHFIKHYWNSPYNGAGFQFQLSLMKEGLAKGIPRSLGHMIALIKWNAIAYFMVQKGGNYLLALSYGTSLFYPFFNEGISQGVITIGSYLKGAQSMKNMFRLLRSSFIMVTLGILLTAIPLLLAPYTLLDLYMKDSLSIEARQLLISCSRWIWVMYVSNGIYLIALAFVTAFKEMWFYLKIMACGVIFWSFLPVYYAIQVKGASPDMFWILVSMQPLFPALILFWMLIRRYFYPLYRVSFNHVSIISSNVSNRV